MSPFDPQTSLDNFFVDWNDIPLDEEVIVENEILETPARESSSEKLSLIDLFDETIGINKDEISTFSLSHTLNAPSEPSDQLSAKTSFSNPNNPPQESYTKEDENFYKSILFLEKRYSERKKSLDSFTGFQDIISAISNYIKKNKNNLHSLSKFVSTSTPSPLINNVQVINNVQANHKWINSLTYLISNLFILWTIYEVEKQFDNYEKEYKDELKTTAATMPKKNLAAIKEFRNQIEKDKAIANSEIPSNSKYFTITSSSFLMNLIIPLTLKTATNLCKSAFNIFQNIRDLHQFSGYRSLQNELVYRLQPQVNINIFPDHLTFEQQKRKSALEIAQKTLQKEEIEFENSLRNCQKIEEVYSKLKKEGISLKISSKIDEFKEQMKTLEFRRQLLISFHCARKKRPEMNEKDIQQLLKFKEKSHNEKIQKTMDFLAGEIIKCDLLDWNDIQKHFSALKIPLDIQHLGNVAPNSKAEWEQLIQDDDFLKILAKVRVEHHETIAQLAKQGVDHYLGHKIEVERKFLHLKAVESTVEILTNLTYLMISIFNGHLCALQTISEIFLIDICKLKIPGVQLLPVFQPLYKGVPFKIGAIALFVARNFLASYYKPNEYSLRAYGHMMYIRLINLSLIGPILLFWLKNVLLVVKVRLIENSIMRTNRIPMEQDSRYIAMNQSYLQKRAECDAHIQKLKAALADMRLQDAMIASNLKSDGLKIIDENFSDNGIDTSLFPEQVIDHFEQNLCGFKLTNESKERFKPHLQELLSLSEDNFFENFSTSRNAQF